MNSSMDHPRRGILLANVGSPDSPAVPDVRRYLGQFLMDERVIDLPWPLRKFIVSGMILPFRPRQSAEAYRAIWTDEGSPLIAISQRVAAALRDRLAMPVAAGMSYGRPSLADGINELRSSVPGAHEVLLVPMFPHYAMSTYESVVVAARKVLLRTHRDLKLIVRPPFYEDPDYIDALVMAAQEHLTAGFDHLLFSYHGLPERHIRKSDPTRSHCLSTPDCCTTPSPAHATCYRAQVLKTTAAFVQRTGLRSDQYSVAFQSRLGRSRWLEPCTSDELVRLAQAGVKRLVVICPAFVADCLETLEEIGIRGRESFRAAGGSEFRLIPCLNDHPRWIEVLSGWCRSDYA
ncbi:MAG: ferrochelatase [Candidatus Zixiibacteriota bacterium]